MHRLELVHVRLIEAPGGKSLRDIVDAVGGKLPDDAARRAFENALLRRGLMPDDEAALSSPKVQLRSIDAYNIVDGFPRLVRASVPAAVAEASYVLDVRAIAPFAVSESAILLEFLKGEHR